MDEFIKLLDPGLDYIGHEKLILASAKKDKLDLHRRFGSVIIGVRNGKTC